MFPCDAVMRQQTLLNAANPMGGRVQPPTRDQLMGWRGRQGPRLRALIHAQESKHPPVR